MCGWPLLQACLRLKGENGIMRKKFQALQKDIEEQREQLTLQHEQQKELYNTIKGKRLEQRVVDASSDAVTCDVGKPHTPGQASGKRRPATGASGIWQ
jgi:hypothetical protein